MMSIGFDPVNAALRADAAFGLLRRLVWHSRLDVSFEEDNTYLDRPTDRHPGNRAVYLHLTCRNLSHFVYASGCRAYLRRFSIQNAKSVFTDHPGIVGPVLLRWASTPTTGALANQPMELDPRGSHRIDLGYVLKDDPRFRFYFPPDYTGAVQVLEPGNYQFWVEVRAANSLPLRKRRLFNLDTTGGLPVVRSV